MAFLQHLLPGLVFLRAFVFKGLPEAVKRVKSAETGNMMITSQVSSYMSLSRNLKRPVLCGYLVVSTCQKTFFITSQKVSCISTTEFKLMLSDLNFNPIFVCLTFSFL